MDTVEWAMPSFMRTFCGTDDIIRFEPSGPADEKNCSDATEYCGYILHRKNPGFVVLHDAIKSALISRMGVVKVYCEKAYTEKEERYEYLTDLDVQALEADENVEIIEKVNVLPVNVTVSQAGEQVQPQQAYFNVTAKRKETRHEICVEGVPPEEIWFSKDNRNVEKLRSIGHDVPRTISDLLSMGYPSDQVLSLPTYVSDDTYGEKLERESYDSSFTDDEDSADPSQRVVTLTDCYMRVDYDGDGIAEYRHIVKCGTVVFENEVVDDHPFALFTPILMPYKLIGLSMYDMVEDLMRIKTAITRQYLDNVYLANTPRTGVVEGMVNLDDLLNPRPGGIVRMKDPNGLVPIQTQDIGPSALAGIAHFNDVRDARTGIKEFSQGLVGEEISKSQIGSQGVAQLADAAAQRIELMARVFAETGIKRLYLLLLKNAKQYQDSAAEIKVSGQWMQVDPRAWANRYDMVISVGVGTASKDRQAQNAMQLLQIQQQASQYGLVQPQNAYNALEDLSSALGKKDASRYFTAPDPNNPPPSQPDPAQVQMQMEQAKMQFQAQLEQMKQQGQIEVERMKQQFQAQQAAQETQLEAERNAAQMQNDMALEQFKAEKQAELERFKAELEHDKAIQIARINAEARIASAMTQGAKDASTATENIAYQERRE